jgi:hypothetical protein
MRKGPGINVGCTRTKTTQQEHGAPREGWDGGRGARLEFYAVAHRARGDQIYLLFLKVSGCCHGESRNSLSCWQEVKW